MDPSESTSVDFKLAVWKTKLTYLIYKHFFFFGKSGSNPQFEHRILIGASICFDKDGYSYVQAWVRESMNELETSLIGFVFMFPLKIWVHTWRHLP